MTDKEIIKALHICAEHEPFEGQQYTYCGIPLQLLFKEILAFVNRQQKEIEWLKEGFKVDFENLASEYDSKIKAEAIKEFANETIDWCRQKLAQEKKNPFGLTGKRLEGYEQAILSVMSYLHSKKE